MSKVPFTKADVVRTIESAKAAGLKVETVEVVTPQGTIIRVSGERKCSSVVNPWDEILSDDNEQNQKARS
jgi:hypothetical protein